MKVISKFHDYYDCVLAMGIDLNTLYIRKKEEVELDEFPFPTFWCRSTTYPKWIVTFRETIVGFCGKIYPILEVIANDRWDDPVFCYSVEDVDAVVEANYRDNQIESYRWKKERKGRNHWRRWRHHNRWPHDQRRQNVEKFFNECEEKKTAYENLFIEHRCPIFVARYDGSTKSTITYNDQLKSLGFVRVFDPYTAFQEVHSYVSGLASPFKEIPEVSDKDLLEAKGFDLKWSFRKEPTKKR